MNSSYFYETFGTLCYKNNKPLNPYQQVWVVGDSAMTGSGAIGTVSYLEVCFFESSIGHFGFTNSPFAVMM